MLYIENKSEWDGQYSVQVFLTKYGHCVCKRASATWYVIIYKYSY